MISTSGAIDWITPWQVPTKSSCRPKSLRKVTNMAATLSARREDGLDQTVKIVSTSLFDDSHPGFSRCRGRLGTDRDGRDRDPELPVGPGGRRRGEHDQVALQRLCRTHRPRPVEGDEVSAELVGEQATSILGPGEQDAPVRMRELGEQPLLRGHRRDEIDLALPGLGGRLPDRGPPPRVAPAAAAKR